MPAPLLSRQALLRAVIAALLLSSLGAAHVRASFGEGEGRALAIRPVVAAASYAASRLPRLDTVQAFVVATRLPPSPDEGRVAPDGPATGSPPAAPIATLARARAPPPRS